MIPNLKRAISISGLMFSGKTSAAKHLSTLYGWEIVSFGDYVRHITKQRNLPSIRESYQIVGQELFESRGPANFLLDTIQFRGPAQDTHLFESIRHRSIVEAVKEIYEGSVVLYLEVDDEVRYSRFQSEFGTDVPIPSYHDFLEMSYQPIEQGIPDIAKIADFVIDASRSLDQVLAHIEESIRV